MLSEVREINSKSSFDNNNLKFMTKSELIIEFEGKLLIFKNPICRKVNRYFIPLVELLQQLKGDLKIKGQTLYIFFREKSHLCIDNNYKFIMINEDIYISLFDLCRIIKIKTIWNYKNRTISLYWDRDKINIQKSIPMRKYALIRLEDITAGGKYIESTNLEKLRVVADYLFSMGVPFHIAWIPRFINPLLGIDNDISRDYSMANADFLFTIEYLLSRNGIIGLHGYTHQFGNEISGEGTEFSENRNIDEQSIRKRAEAAICTANRLELPFKFFESPHYASTAFQQSIFENYFDIIYEAYVGIWGDRIIRSPRNKRTLYVPTPLGYVEGEVKIEEMLKRINNLSRNTLASLFYHPFIEFKYITFKKRDNGYPTFEYSNNSPLHLICTALLSKGYSFTKVTKLTPKNSNCIFSEFMRDIALKIKACFNNKKS